MMPELRIADACGPHERATVEVMHRAQLAERMGVRIARTWVPNGADAVDLVLGGQVDAAMQVGFGPALAAIATGAPIRVVAGANLLSVHAIYSRSAEIRRLDDLRGRTLGIGRAGALIHQLATAALLARGIDPATVRFVEIGNSAAVFAALCAGEVDAGFGEAEVFHNQRHYGVHALDGGVLWDALPHFPNQASFASVAAIAGKREALIRALAAHALLYRMLQHGDGWPLYAAAWTVALPWADPREGFSQWQFYQRHRPFAENLQLPGRALDYLQSLNMVMGLQTVSLEHDAVMDTGPAREALALVGRVQ